MPLSQIVSASIEDGSVAPVDLSSLAQYTGFKNRLFNGAMSIWQRGTSFSTNNTYVYSADRMWVFSGLSTACTFSQVTPTGLADFPFAIRAQRNSGNTGTAGVFIGQIIESNNLQDLQGQAATISFWARAGANYSAGSSLLAAGVYTGTTANQGLIARIGGWTGGVYQSSSPTLTTSWQRFSATFTIASNVQEISVEFNYTPVGTAGAADYFDITGIQIEKGVSATSFDIRPYGAELALCQRYYFAATKYVSALVGGVAPTSTNYPVEMRIAPIIAGGAAGFTEVVKSTTGLSFYQTTTGGQALTFNSEL
jgi:hypothetical protein